MTKALSFLRKQPLITTIIAMGFAVGGIKLIDAEGNFGMGILRLILTAAMCFFLYLISGEKTFKCCEKTTGYIFKHLKGLLIYAGVTLVITVPALIYSHNKLLDGWYIQIFLFAFLTLTVGLFEEFAFRAVLNDGLLYQFRNNKNIFVIIAVFGSLFFGFVHVVGEDISTPLFLAQAVLKTISTGLWGLCLLFLYWKTRNIWGLALLHGLYDYLLAVKDEVFASNQNTGSTYIKTGSLGYVAIGMFGVQTIINIIILILLWKRVVKTIDFDEMRKNW